MGGSYDPSMWHVTNSIPICNHLIKPKRCQQKRTTNKEEEDQLLKTKV